MLSLEGKQLGNYEVVRRIRVGGMGAVYEGKQRTAFDRRVAIKVILGDYAADAEMRRRFAREARTIARLHHPHILPLIEFGEAQGVLFLVMPFIDGGTLTSYLRHSLPDLSEVAVIYQQLLDAVEYAHDTGLIHRDIKSSNVLLEQRRSGPPYIYLADFGLVRASRQTELEQAGKPIPLDQVPGTPHYMAPEQTRGIVTTSTDIYALGVLLYQMLTGELPYNDSDDIKVIQMHLYEPVPSPCDYDASIPSELGEVVRTAMAKQPEARYQNIAELRAAFLAAVKGPIATVQVDDSQLEEIHILPPPPPAACLIAVDTGRTFPSNGGTAPRSQWDSTPCSRRKATHPRDCQESTTYYRRASTTATQAISCTASGNDGCAHCSAHPAPHTTSLRHRYLPCGLPGIRHIVHCHDLCHSKKQSGAGSLCLDRLAAGANAGPCHTYYA